MVTGPRQTFSLLVYLFICEALLFLRLNSELFLMSGRNDRKFVRNEGSGALAKERKTAKNHTRYEVGESHNRLCPEGMRHKEEKEAIG